MKYVQIGVWAAILIQGETQEFTGVYARDVTLTPGPCRPPLGVTTGFGSPFECAGGYRSMG